MRLGRRANRQFHGGREFHLDDRGRGLSLVIEALAECDCRGHNGGSTPTAIHRDARDLLARYNQPCQTSLRFERLPNALGLDPERICNGHSHVTSHALSTPNPADLRFAPQRYLRCRWVVMAKELGRTEGSPNPGRAPGGIRLQRRRWVGSAGSLGGRAPRTRVPVGREHRLRAFLGGG